MPNSPPDDQIDAFLDPIEQAGAISVAVMVSSADGRATIRGSVGALTGDADQRILLGVREMACAVVIGAGTARAEGYRGLLDAEAQARRTAKGLRPEPELIVVDRKGPSVSEIWSQLRDRYPDALIASEGGPTMLGVEVEAGLIDQLVLSLSPMLVGDDTQKRVIEHAAPLGIGLELIGSAAVGNSVFLRYRVA